MHQKLPLYAIISLYACVFLYLLIQSYQRMPIDYAINWTASLGLRQGISIYDGSALNVLGVQAVGPAMAQLFGQSFTSYIGLPITAIFLLPLTFLPFSQSLMLYRLGSLLAYIAGAVIVARTLSGRASSIALLTGAVCLGLWQAVVISLQLGQLDGWIVLLLAIAVYAVHTRHFYLTGACIGIAALLKISPGLLLVYCLLKRQWSLLWSAACTMAVGLTLSWLPQQGAELNTFLFEIAPRLSGGSIHVQNQALGAWLARLTAANPQFLVFGIEIGPWRYVGLLVALCLLLLFWWLQRRQALSALEISSVILIALLAGPITWDHYTSWAIIPCILLMAQLQKRGQLTLAILLVLLALPIPSLHPDVLIIQPWLRVCTGTQTLALLGMLAVYAVNILIPDP